MDANEILNSLKHHKHQGGTTISHPHRIHGIHGPGRLLAPVLIRMQSPHQAPKDLPSRRGISAGRCQLPLHRRQDLGRGAPRGRVLVDDGDQGGFREVAGVGVGDPKDFQEFPGKCSVGLDFYREM